jgi:hypothetical protein
LHRLYFSLGHAAEIGAGWGEELGEKLGENTRNTAQNRCSKPTELWKTCGEISKMALSDSGEFVSALRDQKVAGSNPVTSTISSIHKGFTLWMLDFSYNTILCMSRSEPCSFVLCCFGFGEVFHGGILAGIGFIEELAQGRGQLSICYACCDDTSQGKVKIVPWPPSAAVC